MSQDPQQQQPNQNAWRFTVLLVVLLLGGVVVNGWAYLGEARVSRNALINFPDRVGSWQKFGSDERFDKATEDVLRADDYLLRNYRRNDGPIASFYVGYYTTQRTGASYHSPLNCLPGAGWTMTDPARLVITPTDRRPAFEANRYLIQNGSERQLLIYWYQGRGRALTSEYWGKVYTVWDSLCRRRSDGSMVRVTVPVGTSEPVALRSAENFAADVSALLPEFIPN